MKGIYLSGPITGNEEAVQDFARAEELVKKIYGEDRVKIFNPIEIDKATPCMSYEETMKLDLMILDTFCNEIFMIQGWWGSKGANRELGFAMAKGYKITYEAPSGITDVMTGAR